MDKKEYLNQISSHPTAKSPMMNKDWMGKIQAILHSKFLWIGVGCVVAFIVLAMIGGLLSGGRGDNKDRVYALSLRVSSLNDVISEYQNSVLSSELRGYSASLSSVLSNTATNLNNYISEYYKTKQKEIPKTITGPEEEAKQKLSDELFEARITGRLDQVYAQRMAIEISTIMDREETIHNSINNEQLDTMLSSSYDSLANLYPKFNEFVGT